MHRIIALWAHPRSMSTAIERIMRERGDLHCLHEPFMYDYYVARKVRQMPHFEVAAGRPIAFAETRDMILAQAEKQPVFLKDMSYYMLPYLESDAAFFDRITHAFLIRNPLHAILSYRKLDPGLTSEEIGLAGQWQHYRWLADRGIDAPVIVAEDVRRSPRAVIGALWDRIGLDFIDAAFDWDGAPTPEDWKDVSGWHGAVMDSDGISAPDPREEERKQAAFDELTEKEPHLATYLSEHRAAFDALSARAIR